MTIEKTTGKTIDKTEAQVEELARKGVPQKTIVDLLPDVHRGKLSECQNGQRGIYRDAWLRGHADAVKRVLGTYMQMVESGQSWPATKHYLATQLDIVEPKDPVNITVVQENPFDGLPDSLIEQILECKRKAQNK